jgi:hypothetical protein
VKKFPHLLLEKQRTMIPERVIVFLCDKGALRSFRNLNRRGENAARFG